MLNPTSKNVTPAIPSNIIEGKTVYLFYNKLVELLALVEFSSQWKNLFKPPYLNQL